MLDSIYALSSEAFTIGGMLACTAVSLILGIVVALVYMFRNTYSKNLAVALVLLPVLVQVVISLVNGNLGAGVAVMGAFSLVRFRSVAGGAKEITCIFFSMAIGLATGMGYLTYAAIFTFIVALSMLLLTYLQFGEKKTTRSLRITIPEDLDYTGIFDDLFQEYTSFYDLNKVKTTNLGSLYELQYTVILSDAEKEKELIDKIRCRNGNLNIACGKMVEKDEL